MVKLRVDYGVLDIDINYVRPNFKSAIICIGLTTYIVPSNYVPGEYDPVQGEYCKYLKCMTYKHLLWAIEFFVQNENDHMYRYVIIQAVMYERYSSG